MYDTPSEGKRNNNPSHHCFPDRARNVATMFMYRCVTSQDTIEFSHQHGIKPKTVVFEGVDRAPEAYAAMRNGDYRVVIKVATD